MKNWTHISGTILVNPLGDSQPEKRYILEMILRHLPKLDGYVYVVPAKGFESSQNFDDFGCQSNLLSSFEDKLLKQQDTYILVVDCHIGEGEFSEIVRCFMKWLCRLAKRIFISYITIRIEDDDRDYIFTDDSALRRLYEWPSWANNERKPSWGEAFMYERAKHSMFPLLLEYKYCQNDDTDREMERRMEWRYKK